MEQKFIKLTSRTEEYYVNPHMITLIKRDKNNGNVVLYLFNETSVRPQESLEEIMSKIKDASKITFQM
jgi:hypothetical protein